MLGPMTLFYTALQIFGHFQVHQTLSCDSEVLTNWLLMVSRNYYELPYHSGTHGASLCFPISLVSFSF